MLKVVFRYFVLLLTCQLYGAISKTFQGPRWADSKMKFFPKRKKCLLWENGRRRKRMRQAHRKLFPVSPFLWVFDGAWKDISRIFLFSPSSGTESLFALGRKGPFLLLQFVGSTRYVIRSCILYYKQYMESAHPWVCISSQGLCGFSTQLYVIFVAQKKRSHIFPRTFFSKQVHTRLTFSHLREGEFASHLAKTRVGKMLKGVRRCHDDRKMSIFDFERILSPHSRSQSSLSRRNIAVEEKLGGKSFASFIRRRKIQLRPAVVLERKLERGEKYGRAIESCVRRFSLWKSLFALTRCGEKTNRSCGNSLLTRQFCFSFLQICFDSMRSETDWRLSLTAIKTLLQRIDFGFIQSGLYIYLRIILDNCIPGATSIVYKIYHYCIVQYVVE